MDLHVQPFELNPQMGPEGQDIVEHIAQKYGHSDGNGMENEKVTPGPSLRSAQIRPR